MKHSLSILAFLLVSGANSTAVAATIGLEGVVRTPVETQTGGFGPERPGIDPKMLELSAENVDAADGDTTLSARFDPIDNSLGIQTRVVAPEPGAPLDTFSGAVTEFNASYVAFGTGTVSLDWLFSSAFGRSSSDPLRTLEAQSDIRFLTTLSVNGSALSDGYNTSLDGRPVFSGLDGAFGRNGGLSVAVNDGDLVDILVRVNARTILDDALLSAPGLYAETLDFFGTWDVTTSAGLSLEEGTGIAPVPLPASAALLIASLLGLGGLRKIGTQSS